MNVAGELQAQVDDFRAHIIESGVLDPEGTHHEFVSGMHGQKLDFDTIATGTPLYEEWVNVAAGFIEVHFPELPQVILGVANGTNRVAMDVAKKFGSEVQGAVSEKDPNDSKRLHLSDAVATLISEQEPKFVLVLEDVGTTGSNSVQVALGALGAGAQNVEVVSTWQRRPNLERLERVIIPYTAIIKDPLETLTPEECQTSGFCAKGWELIERPKG